MAYDRYLSRRHQGLNSPEPISLKSNYLINVREDPFFCRFLLYYVTDNIIFSCFPSSNETCGHPYQKSNLKEKLESVGHSLVQNSI